MKKTQKELFLELIRECQDEEAVKELYIFAMFYLNGGAEK